MAAGLGLAPEDAALAAHHAYHRFRQLQHSLRLQGERYARIDPREVAAEVAAVRQLWSTVLGDG
jgi:glutamate-ammonia-ligase adenylyltransferase